ncbi:10548_t:CDS:2, partial [Cetraspora pellucida]
LLKDRFLSRYIRLSEDIANYLSVFKVIRVAAQKLYQNLNAKDPIIVQFLNDYFYDSQVLLYGQILRSVEDLYLQYMEGVGEQ